MGPMAKPREIASLVNNLVAHEASHPAVNYIGDGRSLPVVNRSIIKIICL